MHEATSRHDNARARGTGLIAATVVAVALMVAATAPRLSAAPTAGRPAPAFTATTVDGKKISLAKYKGKSAVLLNFYSNT